MGLLARWIDFEVGFGEAFPRDLWGPPGEPKILLSSSLSGSQRFSRCQRLCVCCCLRKPTCRFEARPETADHAQRQSPGHPRRQRHHIMYKDKLLGGPQAPETVSKRLFGGRGMGADAS